VSAGSTALVVTTYERPDALAAVLASAARQTAPPAQIIVADDGSGEATRFVIENFKRSSFVPVRAVAQPHAGFRLARLRNLAIAATAAEYLVFVDGDMVLHPDFIADHVAIARRGCFTQGVRVLADEVLTRRLLDDPSLPVGLATAGVGALRRAYLLRAPALASLARTAGNHVIALKGCNQGFWRRDLVRVNGYNEAFEGWGPEDKEIAARLEHAGVRRQTLLFGGIALHLHHPPASRSMLAANLAVLEDTKRSHRVRCERGLDSHPG
jgi:glycosyltransferase involved in cell wall biosynthesis